MWKRIYNKYIDWQIRRCIETTEMFHVLSRFVLTHSPDVFKHPNINETHYLVITDYEHIQRIEYEDSHFYDGDYEAVVICTRYSGNITIQPRYCYGWKDNRWWKDYLAIAKHMKRKEHYKDLFDKQAELYEKQIQNPYAKQNKAESSSIPAGAKRACKNVWKA